MSKHVIVLVGPKGAGKSTIGDFLARELGLHFVRVEPMFLEVRARLGGNHPEYERRGFELLRERLREELSTHDAICFESTGAAPEQLDFTLDGLRDLAHISLVRVFAGSEQCLARVRARDTSIHIPVSDDQVERINAIASRVSLPWAADIDNSGDFQGAVIAATVREILSR